MLVITRPEHPSNATFRDMSTTPTMTTFSNQTFDQIDVGASVSVSHNVTRDEVELLALVSGDALAFGAPHDDGRLREPVCEGVSAEALVHGLLKRRLPGRCVTPVRSAWAMPWRPR